MTDEEDYSVDDLSDQPSSLRCYYDTVNAQGNKLPVQRYVDALKALRPGYQQLVVFAAIAGIPAHFKQADFDMDGDELINQDERDAFCQALFSDPLMLEVVGEPDRQNLMPSCTLRNELYDPNNPNMTEKDMYTTKAMRPRRIAEVAQGFGENGVIESICQENFTRAMHSIIEAISRRLGGVCLPRKLKRNAEGLVECDVVWGMPAGRGCDLPFLRAPTPERHLHKSGRNLCVVDQVPVLNPLASDPEQALATGQQGWYYDDFSTERLKSCKGEPNNLQRIAFTMVTTASGQATAEPPAGATVELQCLNETYGALAAEDKGIASLGFECTTVSEASDCGPPPMRYHPMARTCVISCGSNEECPAAWVCDLNEKTAFAQTAGFAVCVNPICDSPEGEARNCGNSDVGEACLPRLIGWGGFDENEAYLETNSPDCETCPC